MGIESLTWSVPPTDVEQRFRDCERAIRELREQVAELKSQVRALEQARGSGPTDGVGSQREFLKELPGTTAARSFAKK